MTMEKLGVSQEQLKSELTQELAVLLEKKNQLTKTASHNPVEVDTLDVKIQSVRTRMDEIV